MDIRQLLLAAFDVEHREHIDAIRAALGGGAEAPDWNDVFRRAHSLKGASRAVDLPAVEAVAHRLETLFDRIVAGTGVLDGAAAAAVHLALDRIEAYVGGLDDGVGAPMPDDALRALDRCLDPKTPVTPVPDAPFHAPPAPVATVAPPAPAPVQPPPEPAHETGALLRVPAEAIDALTRASHELASAVGGEAAVAEGLARLTRRAAELGLMAERLRGTATAGVSLRTLETDLLALAREAADLSRLRLTVASAVEAAVARIGEQAERLALVPAETVFGGFPRALRDLAREGGQDIAVQTLGLDLPVDRAMLQALKDPVLHALRNALSHGAEAPEARRRAGKPAALAIGLAVAVRGGRLVVTVHDDGRGPDLAGIAGAARRRGLTVRDEDPEAILTLVFEPGLSTAAEVDTLSGRGIGLSVVADAVRRLGGHVRLGPREPWGTDLVMSLPLQAARRPMLLVEAARATYAVPSAAVERVVHLDRAGLDRAMGRSVARIDAKDGGGTLPVVALRDLFGQDLSGPEAERADTGGRLLALLLRAGGRRVLLTVDALREVRTHLVLPAPPIGADPRLISGTVILGDRPVLVLEPEGLMARAAEAGPDAAGATGGTIGQTPRSPTRAPGPATTILVVDDSITTRTLEKGILEAAGYRVVVCVDGQDAIERLRAGIEPIALVLADVEMPRLDGFGLLKAIRAEESLARLPVILMTSRGDAGDVARGLDLGADAYLTKQSFDQRRLLDTIGQLL
ncbi:response regulator receiver protein [Methylobacterium sp. Leaf99]|uniref:hybrid sensor histidine kinase/response regulator n=2 Tax=unclassified Methylobacterium TaxID=2615210 RepID=UPI0006FA4CA8|nr:response regulator [Methylobacterium sp. Leaf99]KQP08727.1 response regulator receiver protein [Methylobacterium sp. Leaf99]